MNPKSKNINHKIPFNLCFVFLIMMAACSCNTIVKSPKPFTLNLNVNHKNVILSKLQKDKLKKMALAYLESSKFNSTGTGTKIKFNQNKINVGYANAIKSDHIEVIFGQPFSTVCHGGKVSFTKIVIGSLKGKKMTVGDPYAITKYKTIIGFSKFSGNLSVEFKTYLSSILNEN